MIEATGDVLWILVIGFIVAFFLAFGVGANDVANSFGTSVGSKVLTLRNACILASIFELLGATLLGAKVSDTVRKDIFDVNLFESNPTRLMLGHLVALGASAIWTAFATFLKLPISGTHSIVGAMIGIALVSQGWSSIYWLTLLKIGASWFLTPVASGIVSIIIYWLMQVFILRKEKIVEPGLRSLPIFFGITLFVYLVFILHDGPDWMPIPPDKTWIVMVASLTFAIVTAVLIWFFWVPYLRTKILGPNADSSSTQEKEATSPEQNMVLMANIKNNRESLQEEPKIAPKKEVTVDPIKDADALETMLDKNGIQEEILHAKTEVPDEKCIVITVPSEPKDKAGAQEEPDDPPEIVTVFSPLQQMTAVCGSFAHGANDVSNAIGPLISLYLIHSTGLVDSNEQTPVWILAYGGAGIIVGLWVWGRRVIKTMGEDLTKITPSSGFAIEIGAALTVLLASKFGIPISTTHCKVGSVAFVGVLRSPKGFRGVDWGIFRQIIYAWVTTVPVSCGLAALLMFLFSFLV